MSAVHEYLATLASCPLPRDHEVRKLLVEISEAWLSAENGIAGEAESRRWSPVCDAAQRLAEALAVTA